MTDIGIKSPIHVMEKIGIKYLETFPYDLDTAWRKKGDLTTSFVLNRQ